MKSELNHENKAKFFALYWLQEVAENPLGKLDVNGGVLEYVSVGEMECHLNLKPLSSISDEDAIEVAKIYGLNEFSIRSKSQHGIKDFGSKHGELTLFNDLSFGGGSSSSFDTDYFAKNIAFDFLRSRGYALPWMGLSVDEMVASGWIKLVEG